MKKRILSIAITLLVIVAIIIIENPKEKSLIEQKVLLYAQARRFQTFSIVYTIYNPFQDEYKIMLKGKQIKEVLFVTIAADGSRIHWN